MRAEAPPGASYISRDRQLSPLEAERSIIPQELLGESPPRMIARRSMGPLEAISSFNREALSFIPEKLGLYSHPIYRNRDMIPQGNGETIMISGGLMAPGFSFDDLSYWLNTRGYRVVKLPFPNMEQPEVRAEMIQESVREERKHSFKITYIGQSKAGYDAYVTPDDIDTIITLGSPTNFPIELHPFVHNFYGLVSGNGSEESLVRKVLTNGYSEALGKVRKVSIIGEYDEIDQGRGNWSGLADEEYSVPTTHFGLSESPQAYQIIGQVLASQSEVKAA